MFMYSNGIWRQRKNFKDVLRQGKRIKSKYFLGKTFSAKLFIKLCSKSVDTSIICMEILNFEQENRTKEDIETVLPWMKKLNYFYEYISMKETEQSKKELLKNLIFILSRKIFYKNTITKKIDNNNRILCIILEGVLIKLDLVFYREVLSLEDYLQYLIKMEIMDEKEIINKCLTLNKSSIDIGTNSIKEFCLSHDDIYNYHSMKEQALKELIQYGITFPKKEKGISKNKDNKLKSIDDYLKIFLFKSNPKNMHDNKKAYFTLYLGKYVKNGIIKRGQYLGSFLNSEIKDPSRYISKEKTIVAIFNKEKYYTNKLYSMYIEKMIRVFRDIKNKFFIFHYIPDDIFYQKYVPFMHYHKFYKGEKIFLQNSIYEGIYLLIEGTIKISMNTSIDEMRTLIGYLTFSLNNFHEYISKFNNEELTNYNSKNNLKYSSKETIELYSKKNTYEISTIKDFNILGTNETYEHKTELYYFTAECISDSATLYFFPKCHFNNLVSEEKTVYNSLIELVEFRIKDIIWKMKRNIRDFESDLGHKKIKDIANNSFNNYIQNLNNKNKIIIHRNETNSNNNLFLTKINFDKSIISHRNKLLFHTNIDLNQVIDIKKLKNENEKNKEGFITTRNKKNNSIKLNHINISIPSIYNNSTNKRDENYVSLSHNKNRNINNIPNIFPFIITDTKTKRKIYKGIYKNDDMKPMKTISGVSNLKLRKILLRDNQD